MIPPPRLARSAGDLRRAGSMRRKRARARTISPIDRPRPKGDWDKTWAYLKAAARVLGADTPRLFASVLLPLLMPGVLAALLLALVRTIAMFELTFLTNGPTTQTLVVAHYHAVFAAGVRATPSIDAMAVIYMMTSMIRLLIAHCFVNPTEIVARAGNEPRK
jgi:putative spermidine/putrescine transport system permease protein